MQASPLTCLFVAIFSGRLCCMGKLNAQNETACGETAKQQLNQSIC